MPHFHMADEPLHVALAFGEGGHIIMLHMNAGLFPMNRVLLLSHNTLRQKQEKQYYEQIPEIHLSINAAKLRLLSELSQRNQKTLTFTQSKQYQNDSQRSSNCR